MSRKGSGPLRHYLRTAGSAGRLPEHSWIFARTARFLGVFLVGMAVLALSASLGCEKRPRMRSLPPDAGLKGGELIFEEGFEGSLDQWTTQSKNWRIVDGRLYTGDKPEENEGLWLEAVSLPRDMRIEYEATSVSWEDKGKKVFEGDIKCEFGGRDREHLSGYIVIFGGWNNSKNIIARQEEHEAVLVEDTKKKVKEGQTYSLSVIRIGNEVKLFVDGELLLRTVDSDLLTGGVFGFNNWNARVYFDNVRVYAL